MITQTNHKETFRFVPTTSVEIPPERVAELLKSEWELFTKTTGKSAEESRRSFKSLPLGVTSSFQHWDPYPISIVSAKGAWMTDVDGRELLDLSMGFGAMLAGHLNPTVVEEVKNSLETGMLFVTPSPISTDAAERICRRFVIDQVRFTNSGTESTMYAVRTARAATGKDGILKVEGGYHGSYDPFVVSAKPPVDLIGDVEDPIAHVPAGIVPGDIYVVSYNDAASLERIFEKNASKIACFIVEPVMENLGIVLPDAGYLERVRELCDEYNVVLIFDEVKTGLTAGHQGAAQRLGVIPDLITLAKSIGGGLTLAAFGGKKKYMDFVTNGKMAHFGTFNGNPLAMAGIRAVDKICTKETLAVAEAFNQQALDRINVIIEEYQLPAHTVGFGVKGCITWSTTPLRNYRDYKETDFAIAELSWLYSLNRGIITPPGLDEQWLISLAHGQREVDLLVEDFLSFAKTLRA
ncbi:MAG: aminotransferase class III-fold pyridoxal phosphate-dependent enzyme [Streptomycetaceae bacterium]|nr:MAG: aminotransferase class III-fold pyridoxal phosphate-dependent enzyme [Streptomycetaceae bacterium]